MFLKFVNYLRNASIAARLSFFYAISSCLMLLLLSVYAYWALTDILTNANEKFLKDEVRVFRNILTKHPDNANLLAQEVEWVPEELEASEYHYYARISDPKTKSILAITQGMPSLFKNVSFPEAAKVNMDPEETEILTDNNGLTYLLISAYAKVGDTESTRLIEVALDISPQQNIIASYRRNLFLVLAFGIACAILMGIWIAKKSMNSLNEITQYAKHISISELKTISIANCPKELQNLIAALNNMLLRIDTAFKRLTLFSKELAHELRTPINNLLGEAEITLSRPRSLDEYKEIITSSIEEYLRISRMIENILFIARTENPAANLKFEPIDVVSEFEKIAENFDPLLQEKRIHLEIKGRHTIIAEPNLLRRALNNLLSNAIRYTPETGKIQLSCEKIGNEIQITVQDNGLGISEEHLPFICDRFYHIKHDGYIHGLGLGLAIVDSIMDLHNGLIKIVSHLGTGTTIYLIFPLL